MPEEKNNASSSRRWTIADLLDFEFFLRVDDDAENVATRDREIAERELAPVLGEQLRADATPADRAKGLRLWLNAMRTRAEKSGNTSAVTPGESFVAARRTITLVLAILMMIAGASLAVGLLHREWRYYNVIAFLAFTLGPQLFLLLLFVLGWLGRVLLRQNSPGTRGLFQALTAGAIDWAATKARGRGEKWSRKARQTWADLRRRPWLAWPIVSATQTASIWFNVGLIAGLLGVILVMDVRFFWESTPAVAAVDSFQKIAHVLSAPWSWAFPGEVPTAEQIAGSRIELTGAKAGLKESIDSAEAWFGFLMLTLISWGLLPRVLTRLISAWATHHAVSGYGFNDRPHRELWRRLTDLQLDVSSGPGQDDDAIVVRWGGVEVADEDLRRAMLQQLRLNPVESLIAGGIDPSADETAVAKAAAAIKERGRKVRIVIVAEAWALVPRDLSPFLRDLRKDVGNDVRIVCFIVGLPSADETSPVSPKQEDLDSWNRFAAEMDDGNLFISAVKG